MTPLVKMHTLGHDFIPEPIHAGGLRYHGMSPLVSLLKEHGLIEAQAVHQTRDVRGRRPVRPGRGDPAGAGADPRHPGRHRRGARRPARRASPGSSCSTCAATATSTCRPTSATCPGRSRTTSTRPNGSPTRSRPWRHSRSDAHGRSARRPDGVAPAIVRAWTSPHRPSIPGQPGRPSPVDRSRPAGSVGSAIATRGRSSTSSSSGGSPARSRTSCSCSSIRPS